jgi:hypothetical protein
MPLGFGRLSGVDYLVVGIVCASGLVIPIALGRLQARERRRVRGR